MMIIVINIFIYIYNIASSMQIIKDNMNIHSVRTVRELFEEEATTSEYVIYNIISLV